MNKKKKVYLYLGLICALSATTGSLFFSEILKFAPCILCWYQRIVMYPLVILFAVAILRKDTKVHLYVLPLTIIGIVISLFHNLVYFHIIPEAISPCLKGVSCTTKYLDIFGFITIPFLSFLSFAFITIIMYLYSKEHDTRR